LGFRRAKRPSKLRRTHRRRLSSERLEDRQLLAADIAITGSPWQNADNARDVNNDGQVTPLDAFVLVYDLTNNGPCSLPTAPAPPDEPYLDVDGDGSLSEADLNLVIDYLRETGQISDDDFYGGTGYDAYGGTDQGASNIASDDVSDRAGEVDGTVNDDAADAGTNDDSEVLDDDVTRVIAENPTPDAGEVGVDTDDTHSSADDTSSNNDGAESDGNPANDVNDDGYGGGDSIETDQVPFDDDEDGFTDDANEDGYGGNDPGVGDEVDDATEATSDDAVDADDGGNSDLPEEPVSDTLNSSNRGPDLVYPLSMRSREGDLLSGHSLIAVDYEGDEPIEFEVDPETLPPGVFIDSQGNIRGRIRFDVTNSSKVFLVAITLRDSLGNETNTALPWTVLNTRLESLTGTETYAGASTSNRRTVTYLAADSISIVSGNQVELDFAAPSDATVLGSDVRYVLSISTRDDGSWSPPSEGTFAVNPTVPLQSGELYVGVGIDEDENGSLERDEMTHGFYVNIADISAAGITVRRTSPLPQNSFFPLSSENVLASNWTEAFRLENARILGTSLIKWDVFESGVLGAVVSSGVGKVATTSIPINGNYKFRFFLDRNDNGYRDFWEPQVKEAFSVASPGALPYTVYDPSQDGTGLLDNTYDISVSGNGVVFVSNSTNPENETEFIASGYTVHLSISSWNQLTQILTDNYDDDSLDYIILTGHGSGDGGAGTLPPGGLSQNTLTNDAAQIIRAKLKKPTFDQQWGYFILKTCDQAIGATGADVQTLSDQFQRPVKANEGGTCSGVSWDHSLNGWGQWDIFYPR
jgi:hypothetical protein